METFIVEHEGETLEIEIYPKEKMEELKERVKIGNNKLIQAWEQIKAMDHESQEWKDAFQRWHFANVKLGYLCDQLEALGYTDCLFLDQNGKKTRSCLEGIGCRACPSSTRYWEQEFMEL